MSYFDFNNIHDKNVGGTETPPADVATPRPPHGLNIRENKICVGELTMVGICTRILS